MKAKIFAQLLLISTVLCSDLYAQNSQYPEVYYSELREYLDSLSTEDHNGSLIIRNLLTGNRFDEAEIGIYTFYTLDSHTRVFLFFFNGTQIQIIRKYDPDIILEQSIEFVNTYQSQLDKLDKAKYYNRIIETVIANLAPPSMLPPPPIKNDK